MKNSLAIAIILFVLAGLLFASMGNAAEFTINETTGYHAAISGACGGIGDGIFYATKDDNGWSENKRILVAGTLCMIPGGFKEALLDDYIDWGDMLGNAIGAFGVPIALEKGNVWVRVFKDEDMTMISVTGNY